MLFDQEYAVQQTIKAQRKEAREEGREEGLAEGQEIGMLKAFFNMVRKGILSVSTAAKETGMKEDQFQALMNQQQAEEAGQGSGT